MLADRLAQVRRRIEVAAQRAGVDPHGITLLAVSKVKPAADIRAAYEAGQRDFGESYVQEFQAKARELTDLPDARFHFIGKLQSNKTRPAAALFQTIHTVDSAKIARRLDDQTEHPLDIFLEVKLSGEPSKGGLPPENIDETLELVRAAKNLRLRGLMTMPPWSDDPEAARPYFQQLRKLAEDRGLSELSMGMSHDLEVAIQEGSTLVRVGTAIFGKRVRPQ